MLHFLKILLVFAFAAGSGFAYADPPGRVGRLNYVSGAVSFAPGEAPDQWTAAVLNRPLTGGDRLWADRDAHGELHVGSTAVRFGSFTQLDVLDLDDERIQLRLSQGVINVRVRELDAHELVEIATPAGAALLTAPGSYRIAADPESQATYVSVNSGEAEILTPLQTFVVPPGQLAVLSAGGPASFQIAGQPDDFDRWSADRDRLEDRVTSTRYVSSYMTGYEDLDRHGSWRTVAEYGPVWVPARVAPGWAPYRHGHWVWVSPWGWTWVDDAPWGFAPFHYGRWLWIHDHWAWAPGRLVRRPIYAPALVAFVGGPHWSVSLHGPAVGWFPLGWGEPFHPWYRASPIHLRNINIAHVTNIHRGSHVHRHRPHAVTVVPHRSFVSGHRAAESRVHIAAGDLARAQVLRERMPAEPGRSSIVRELSAHRPPSHAVGREVVAVTRPGRINRDFPASGQQDTRIREPGNGAPSVRVLGRERLEPRRAERGSVESRRAENPRLEQGRAEGQPGGPPQGRSAVDPRRSRPQAAGQARTQPDTPGTRREPPQGPRAAEPAAATPAARSSETPARRPAPPPGFGGAVPAGPSPGATAAPRPPSPAAARIEQRAERSPRREAPPAGASVAGQPGAGMQDARRRGGEGAPSRATPPAAPERFGAPAGRTAAPQSTTPAPMVRQPGNAGHRAAIQQPRGAHDGAGRGRAANPQGASQGRTAHPGGPGQARGNPGNRGGS
jgi:hypothetical protein